MNENFLQAILQSIAWLLTRLLSVLTPLFIGLAIAYLLHPAVDWLTQKLRRRGLAILLTYLLAACFLGGLICGFVILIRKEALEKSRPRSSPILRVLIKLQMPTCPIFCLMVCPRRSRQGSSSSRKAWSGVFPSRPRSHF